MSDKLTIDELPKANNSLKFKIKNFFNHLFSGKNILSPKQNIDKNYDFQVHPEKDIIIRNFESFVNKTVEDVMIPRSDIISVNHEISLEDLSKTIIKYGHTRTLVYKENLDNVIGFLHIKDLFEIIANQKNIT